MAARPASALVEAIVALVLVGVAALSLGGASAAATALLREASLAQSAALAAEVVLDSLAHSAAAPGGLASHGSRVQAPFTLEWTAASSGGAVTVDLAVRYASGSALREQRYERCVAPPPERLPAP